MRNKRYLKTSFQYPHTLVEQKRKGVIMPQEPGDCWCERVDGSEERELRKLHCQRSVAKGNPGLGATGWVSCLVSRG